MGLLDSVLGAAVGGALGRGGFGGGGLGGLAGGGLRGGGMMGSPVVKALMLALAAKAAHEYMSRNRAGQPGQQQPLPSGTGGAPGGGGLGGMLGGMLGGGQGGLGGLGGLLGGLGGAGALGDLVEQFNRRGQAPAVNSWVSSGPNQPIPPEQLAEVIDEDDLQVLERETGLPRPQLLQELSRELPDAIDHLTPEGRLPSDSELMRSGG